MFVSSFVFSPVGSPSNTVSFRPARLIFRLNLNRPEKLAILLSLACSTLTGKERANASLTRLERTRNYRRVNLFPADFRVAGGLDMQPRSQLSPSKPVRPLSRIITSTNLDRLKSANVPKICHTNFQLNRNFSFRPIIAPGSGILQAVPVLAFVPFSL
jgi:hypothetical protein